MRRGIWAGFWLMIAAGFSGMAFAQPCPPMATFDTYLANGNNASCTVEDKTLSDFTYGSMGVFPVPAASVTVTPVTILNDPGLAFSFSLASTSTMSSALGMTYTVTAPATHPIGDISIAITGTPAMFSPEDTETGNTTLVVTANSMSLSDSNNFLTPQTTVLVENSALASFGATLTSITSQFSEVSVVPEPSSTALLGLSLGFLALARRAIQRFTAAS